ncbi:hypothetical protein HNQ94_001003 [Salirhabdus euzebyi]|uniref:Uncharacterized protein n=1 Tax=Salirhabdus euzebyi TaxID=394506 RepID=A0A841Q348_9BACI|nr:hypothetical protein [Salirhabdus euzebyi]MBB6452558.1 hypothetical protein [Salirhabdus euzebyi]
MNNDQAIKIFRIFVSVTIVISLIVNFTLLVKVNQLEDEVNHVSYYQHDLMNNVNNQTGHMQTVLSEFKEEQSWISRINMDVNTNKIEDGEVQATFKWQVKELQTDSEVVFHYTYGNSDDYIEVPAKKIQQGLFEVNVPFEVGLEPQWEIMNMTNSNAEQEMSKQAMEEKMIAEERQHTLKYFVTVSHGDSIKSGEIYTDHLGHLGTSFYGIIQTDIHIDKNHLSVNLVNRDVNQSPKLIVEAYLLKYENEKFLEEEVIKLQKEDSPSNTDIRFFNLDSVEVYDDMRLIVKVVYSNGEVFEKEVY